MTRLKVLLSLCLLCGFGLMGCDSKKVQTPSAKITETQPAEKTKFEVPKGPEKP